ncbi:unnamed protein product, partial [marine sediment metagenome]
MFFWDGTIFLLIPAFVFALWARAKVRGAYAKYSKVRARSGMTGAEVAAAMLRRRDLVAGEGRGDAADALAAVEVHAIAGQLSDHYDPRSRVL